MDSRFRGNDDQKFICDALQGRVFITKCLKTSGREMHLIEPSGGNFRQNYQSIAALLSDAAFRYDTSYIDDCPPVWASLFAGPP